jgi:lipopolysaccharide transport protein LptA
MTKPKLARTVRLVFAGVLVAVVAVILWHFLSHRRPRTVVPQKEEVIPAEKVERQDGVEHLDFKGDRVIQAKAKRHYAGEDGRYVLEGDVEIRELGREEGEEILLSGEKVSYDKDWKEAYLEGQAKLQYRGLIVESAAFTYLNDDEILTSDRGVAFSSKKISGEAGRMTYSFREESIRLEQNVELQVVEETESDIPFLVQGDVVTFRRRQRKGTVQGNASFSLGESRGQADSLFFELTADEQNARSFSLKGNAQASLVEEAEKSAGQGDSSVAKRHRDISADVIDLRVFKNMHTIHSVVAKDHCRLNFYTSEGGDTELRAGRIRIFFDRKGGLRELKALDGARLTERGGPSDKERFITGQEIFIGERGSPWKIKAREGGEARIDSPDSEVTAKSLGIQPRREILNAAGDVKVILKPKPGGDESVGFFSSELPVFGAAQRVRFEEKTGRLLLRKDVRMWQGKEIIFADELTALKKTGEFTGEGHVRAFLHYSPKTEGAEEEKIEIGGEKMNFIPQESRLTYEKASWLKSKKIRLNSERIMVRFRENSAEIQFIEAQGNVTIAEDLREGRGDNAIYLLEEETMVLTGNPKVTDKEKGVIEGDKLTFRLGEGRIQVENKDRERSTTVIKS